MSDFNSIDRQFVRHDGSKVARRGELGHNFFGQPEGYYTYTPPGGRGLAIECAADLTFARVHPGHKHAHRGARLDAMSNEVLVLTGVQFICPRCKGGCYINCDEDASGHAVSTGTVHWDDLKVAENDGLIRPTFTINEPFACDYGWGEVNGIVAPRDGTLSRCGFRGVFEKGRLIDHQVRLYGAGGHAVATAA